MRLWTLGLEEITPDKGVDVDIHERLLFMRKQADDAFQRESLAIISAPLIRAEHMRPAHLVSIVCVGSVDVEVIKTVAKEGKNAEECALVEVELLIHNRLMVRWRGLAITMARAYVQQEHPRLKDFLDRNREGWAMSEDGANKYWLTDLEVAAIYAYPRGVI
jgi:hypothetical protein